MEFLSWCSYYADLEIQLELYFSDSLSLSSHLGEDVFVRELMAQKFRCIQQVVDHLLRRNEELRS